MPTILQGPMGPYMTTRDPDIYAYGRPTPWGRLRGIDIIHRDRDRGRRWQAPPWWWDDEDDDSDYEYRRRRHRVPNYVFEGPNFHGPNDRMNLQMMPGMQYHRLQQGYHHRRPHGKFHYTDFGIGHRQGRNRSRSRRRHYAFVPDEYDYQWPAARWGGDQGRAYYRMDRRDDSDEDEESDDLDDGRGRRWLEGPTHHMRMLEGNTDGVAGLGLPARRDRQRPNEYDYAW